MTRPGLEPVITAPSTDLSLTDCTNAEQVFRPEMDHNKDNQKSYFRVL
jgi:hypothetical protein